MTPRIMIVATLLVLGACNAPEPAGQQTPAPAPEAAPDAPMANIYETAVSNPARTDADVARDAGRQPAAVMEFLGIEPGMQVLDLFSGGGYYAELLSYVTGPTGSVTAHNNSAYLQFTGDESAARYGNNRLPNVSVLMAENNELELAPDSYDAVTMILAFHDIYYADPDNGWPAIDGEKLLAELYEGIRPGGILGIVDHYAAPGSPSETGGTTHRIDIGIVTDALESAGFVLEDRSDILRNADDDYSKGVFEPELRGKTDRFVLRFRKPA